VNKRNLERFDLKAAIMFIVAHFLSVFIYDSFVVDDELLNGSGVDLRAMQASIYVIIPMMILSKELKLASLAVAGMYILSASEWLLFDHGIELDIQTYFYSHFSGIIDTLDLIIIYLLGRDSAIRIFNIVFDYCRINNQTRLFRRRTNNNSVCNINLSICYENIKNAKWCK
tara:strand:+ start:210 stop:722 length:513 start_codon:yes stop_codon:yes gene_type:complete